MCDCSGHGWQIGESSDGRSVTVPRDESLCRWIGGILEFKFLRDSVCGQSESSDGEVDKKYNGRTILEVL